MPVLIQDQMRDTPVSLYCGLVHHVRELSAPIIAGPQNAACEHQSRFAGSFFRPNSHSLAMALDTQLPCVNHKWTYYVQCVNTSHAWTGLSVAGPNSDSLYSTIHVVLGLHPVISGPTVQGVEISHA